MRIEIRCRATFEKHRFNGEDEIPEEESGFCDPHNPWGTMSWGDQEPTEIFFDTIWEAAEFIQSFEGGVWDLWECQPSDDFKHGWCEHVTLHVDGPGSQAALTIASALQDQHDENLRRMRHAYAS